MKLVTAGQWATREAARRHVLEKLSNLRPEEHVIRRAPFE